MTYNELLALLTFGTNNDNSGPNENIWSSLMQNIAK